MTDETIRTLIDAELKAAEVIPTEAAARIVGQLSSVELRDWLEASAIRLLAREISDLMRSSRHRAMRPGRSARFKAALDDAGDDIVGLYATWHTVNDTNVRRRLADMTGDDHLYVATSYRSSAEASLMREAFHRVLAKKVGGRRTADVLSEDECQRILDEITAAGRAA